MWTADQERAKAICQTCPLLVPCAVGAFRRREEDGVWAALSAEERQEWNYEPPPAYGDLRVAPGG